MRSFPALGGPWAGPRDEEKVSLFHSDFHTRKSDLHKSRGGPGPRPIPPTAHRNDPLTQRPIRGLKEHNFRLKSLWNLIIDATRSRKYSKASIFRGKSRGFRVAGVARRWRVSAPTKDHYFGCIFILPPCPTRFDLFQTFGVHFEENYTDQYKYKSDGLRFWTAHKNVRATSLF